MRRGFIRIFTRIKEAKIIDTIIHCERCEARCKVAGPRNSDAKMLRRSREPKGLCVNCAVHDWLRNTYPVNIQLAEYGPKGLDHPQIQELFTEIMRTKFADAKPDEIDWDLIVENWDLPFPHKIKPSGMNPCDQQELDAIKAGTHPGIGSSGRKSLHEIAKDGCITSLEQLNELSPGLGDDFKQCLGKMEKGSKLKVKQKEPTLFEV